MRRLSALLQAAQRSARPVLRARTARRPADAITYGRSSGFCIDPIEKRPLNHFLPGTPVLSFGTAGCNLTCKFCQNWDISKARDLDAIQEVASPAAIAETAVRSGCRSVALTYNDPVIFLEYAIDVAQACRERGIKTVAVSAGDISPEPRIEFFRHMDAANIDLKGFSEGFYKNLCSSKLAPVLETLEYLKHETSVWFEITTLLIPGENNSVAEIEAESAWVMDHLGPDVPLHFTASSSGLEVDGQAGDTAADAAHGPANRCRHSPAPNPLDFRIAPRSELKHWPRAWQYNQG